MPTPDALADTDRGDWRINQPAAIRHTLAAEGRNVSLAESSNHSGLSTVSGPTNPGQSGQEPSGNRSDSILVDVTRMLRDLYELIQNHAPAWYTERTDTQVRRALAAAEAAMRVSID